MNADEKRSPGRTSNLDVERIIDAATEIIQSDGIDALSMRRLGKRLEVDPMAIYYHLPNKAAIIQGVVGRVFAEIDSELEAMPSGTWQDQTLFWATTYYAVARRNPQLIIHLINHADASGETVMRVNDHLYAALSRSGLNTRNTVKAADMIVDYIHGVTISSLQEHASQADWRATVSNQLEQTKSDHYPAIRSVFSSLDPANLPVDLEFSIRVILSGLAQIEQHG